MSTGVALMLGMPCLLCGAVAGTDVATDMLTPVAVLMDAGPGNGKCTTFRTGRRISVPNVGVNAAPPTLWPVTAVGELTPSSVGLVPVVFFVVLSAGVTRWDPAVAGTARIGGVTD